MDDSSSQFHGGIAGWAPIITLLILGCLTAFFPVALSARTFFVAATGNDGNSGLSGATAWKSPDRVNSAFSRKAVQAGDTIAFRRGDTFPGALDIRVSGKPGKPIVIDAYGDGVPPVLDSVSHHFGISLHGSRIVITHLQVSEARSAAFRFMGGVSGIEVWDCAVFGTPFMSTPAAFRFESGNIDHITIERVTVRGITDFGFHIAKGTRITGLTIDTVASDSSGYGLYAEGAELSGVRIANVSFCHEANSGIRLDAARARDVEIFGCTASDNRVHGVFVNGDISGLTLRNLTADSNGSHGLYLDTFSAERVIVEKCRLTGAKNEKNGLGLDGRGANCTIRDTIASGNTGDGFNVHGAWTGVRLEHCTADGNGNDGRGWDGDGYTFHENCSGTMVGCTARNNRKSAVAHVHHSAVDMERCIFTHDTNGTIPLVYVQGSRFSLRNCVLYSAARTGAGLFCAEGNILVRNTIISGFDTGFGVGKAAVTQDHNAVFGAKSAGWKGIAPDGTALSADPRFTNPGALDFTLLPDSPCIDAGTDAGSSRDFAETPVPQGNAPDIGAYEFK